MRRQKFRIQVEPKKERKTWQINPGTRIHRGEGYKRSKEKETLKRIIWEEGEED
ncbi:MAG: hypothetical protein IBX64_03535 [Actinobacteria bacterium]|nr:hypothetical protein [Actinomycetota bacterium]